MVIGFEKSSAKLDRGIVFIVTGEKLYQSRCALALEDLEKRRNRLPVHVITDAADFAPGPFGFPLSI